MFKGSTVLSCLCIVLAASSVSSFSGPSRATVSTRVTSRNAMTMRWGLEAKNGVANKPTGNLPEGVALRDTVPFEIRGFSLPLIVFTIGVVLTSSSFAGFFLNDGGGDGAISSLGFVYGIPIFLIGLSLWYAEIPPVLVESTEAGDRAWENKKTENLQKIKNDVTRHRYGDDAHLDSTLDSLGLKLAQKKYPKMKTIIQEESDVGELIMTMVFESAETPYKVWSEPARVERYARFFGPGVEAEVLKVNAETRLVGIKLTTRPLNEEETEAIAAAKVMAEANAAAALLASTNA
mmetsp:Transcript_18597/g.17919  ORF Transcript_18597/g.17919 Transcript_18597/m.17919 type:complete len:292 (+) Transcript_18597:107-982(+)